MKTPLIAAVAAALALAAAAPSQAGVEPNGRTLNGITLNGARLNGVVFNELRWNGQSLAGIAACDPTPIQTCAPNLRAIVLPTGERVALR